MRSRPRLTLTPRRCVFLLCPTLATACASSALLPSGVADASVQAAAAAVAALRSGHQRIQFNIRLPTQPASGELFLCRQLVSALEVTGVAQPYHIFFDTMQDATTWRRNAIVPTCRCDLLGLGSVQPDDGALILITPSNTARVRRMSRKPTEPDTREPDANKLEAVQALVCAAGERPVLMINPSLEALLVTPRLDRPTPPMFLGDFEDAFFLIADAAGVQAELRHYVHLDTLCGSSTPCRAPPALTPVSRARQCSLDGSAPSVACSPTIGRCGAREMSRSSLTLMGTAGVMELGTEGSRCDAQARARNAQPLPTDSKFGGMYNSR